MRTLILIAAVGFQVAVLAYMAGEREIVLRTGRTVYLRTAPVDPRDLFRGDYVRLRYEISSIPREHWRDGLPDLLKDNTARNSRGRGRDQPLYVALRQGTDGLAELDYATDRRPASGLFLRGRVDRWWSPRALPVRYGLEAFFVQQGKGLELERNRSREGIQIPLEMEVAVGRDGTAVLKGYRTAAFGLGLRVVTEKREVRPASTSARPMTRPVPIAAELQFLNTSDKPLAIVDLPGGRAFTMEPDTTRGWRPEQDSWRWVGEKETRPASGAESIKVLQPGETHTVRIDFADPAWYVFKAKEAPKPLTDVQDWQARFRFVYRAPERESLAGVPHAELLWQGRLTSRAFVGGAVD